MTWKADGFIALLSFIVCCDPVRTDALVCLCQSDFFPTPSGIFPKFQHLPEKWGGGLMVRWLTAGAKSSRPPEVSDLSSAPFKPNQWNHSGPDSPLDRRVSVTELSLSGRHMTWRWRAGCDRCCVCLMRHDLL